MGYKNFYHGFKKEFQDCICNHYVNDHDVLIIELNGIFYSSLRKIYGYIQLSRDEFKSARNVKEKDFNLRLFEEIGKQIHNILKKYIPRRKVFLVVDGVAAMMKNSEQRQRRYKNCLENKYGNLFDINSFSPGTKLMHHLTKYIDWFIRKQISYDPLYEKLEIFFSNEKVFGEGEYKAMRFIRQFCKHNEQIAIYTCDSDMILLSMLNCDKHRIMILRNSTIYGEEYVDVNKTLNHIIKRFNFEPYETGKTILVDFIILFFLLGNDYLAASPSIYHFDVLFQNVFPIYQRFGKRLVQQNNQVDRKNLSEFFKTLGNYEKEWLENKYTNQNSYFPDLLFLQTNQEAFDFEAYKRKCNQIHFSNDIRKAQNCYFDNIDNILKMYLDEEFDWDFFYPYYKAPFLSDFDGFNVDMLRKKHFVQNVPKDMYYHLLTVLPPQSKALLPSPFQSIFYDLKFFFPSHIEIDLTGKQKLWEGTVKLPLIDCKLFTDYYLKHREKMSDQEKKRNSAGRTFVYNYDMYHRQNFDSYYGVIQNCPVFCKLIFL